MKKTPWAAVLLCANVFAAQLHAADIMALMEKGNESFRVSDYQGAREAWQAGLEEAKRQRNKQGIGAFTGNLGVVYEKLGDYPKALEYDLQGLANLRNAGDKTGEANMLGNIGNVYMRLGDFPRALEHQQQALKLDRGLGNKKGESSDLGNIGLIYEKLGDYLKALDHCQQALKGARELGNKKIESNNLGTIGNIYSDLGDYPKALEHHLQSLAIKRGIGDRNGAGNSLNNIGNVYDSLLDYPKALDYYQQALESKREIGDKKGEGASLGNIGLVYEELGDYPKALELYQQGLKIERDIGDRMSEGDTFTNLGNLYNRLGDYPKALEHYQQALDLAREISDKKNESKNLANLGVLYEDQGDYPKALDHFQQALGVQQKIGAPIEKIELNIGDVYLDRGEFDRAFSLYSKYDAPLRLGRYYLAKKDFSRAKETLVGYLADAEKKKNSSLLMAWYTNLGLAEEGLKNNGPALQYFRKAAETLEEIRSSLTESQRANFFGAKTEGVPRLEVYEGLVRTTAASQEGAKGAFYYAEFTRGRLLAESISKKYGGTKPRIPQAAGEKETELTDRLASAYKQLQAAFEKNNADRYKELQGEQAALKKEQAAFVAGLRRDYPEYAAIVYPEPIAAGSVALSPDETLLEFEVTGNETLLFILSGKDRTLKLRRIPVAREQLAETVGKYRGAFANVESAQDLAKYDAAGGKNIYDLLFGGELKSLPAGAKLIIAPDEVLGVLPFESLAVEVPAAEKIGEGKHGPFPVGVKYLGDKYAVSYAQSATSLTMLRTLKKGGAGADTALAVVDPVFSAGDSRAKKLSAAAKPEEGGMKLMGALTRWKTMGAAGTRGRGEGNSEAADADAVFPRLEKTAEIGRQLKELFGGAAAVVSDEKARKEDILKLPLDKYKYLVFGTHGILDGAVPYIRQPALVLNQVGNRAAEDGFLTMTEVMGLKLGAEVAALTACETGVGKYVSGEGVMGMGRAFQFAGAGNVLMSLWSVSEDATVALSGEFFKQLKAGRTPAEALALARTEIRRQGYEHPFYWSAFILMGN